MEEQEAWGVLSEKLFSKFISVFTKEFGKPQKHKRLAISFWHPDINNNADTRIRITDGVPQIMQKTGEWENTKKWVFNELPIDIAKDPEKVFVAYKILRNLINREGACRFIQHENSIFDAKGFEIKLAKQFGKSTKYVFEVEIKKKGANLEEFLKNWGLAKYVRKTDVAFWDKWNKEVNLADEELENKGVKKLIKSYM